MVSRLPPALGSRWMSAATGDWPGWLAVKVARRPEHQVWGEREGERERERIRKGAWGISPGQVRWVLGRVHCSHFRGGPGLLWFPGHRRGFGVGGRNHNRDFMCHS